MFSINEISFDRIRTFAAMLRQEAGWFDVAEHTPTALGARLVADAGILSGVNTIHTELMSFYSINPCN